MHGKNTSININIKLANFFCIVCKISSVLSAFFFQSGQIYHNVVFFCFLVIPSLQDLGTHKEYQKNNDFRVKRTIIN